MKLVFEYHWSIPHEAQGTITRTFEHKSIDEFKLKALIAIDEYLKTDKDYICFKILDIEVARYELDDFKNQIEHQVYTLEEWFEKNKTQI